MPQCTMRMQLGNLLLAVALVSTTSGGSATFGFITEDPYVELSENATPYELCVNSSTEMAIVTVVYQNGSAQGESACKMGLI